MSTTGFHVRGHLGTASWHLGILARPYWFIPPSGSWTKRGTPSSLSLSCCLLLAPGWHVSLCSWQCAVSSPHPPVDQSGICVPCSHWYSCLNQSLNSSRHAHPSHQQGGPAAGGAMAGACWYDQVPPMTAGLWSTQNRSHFKRVCWITLSGSGQCFSKHGIRSCSAKEPCSQLVLSSCLVAQLSLNSNKSNKGMCITQHWHLHWLAKTHII